MSTQEEPGQTHDVTLQTKLQKRRTKPLLEGRRREDGRAERGTVTVGRRAGGGQGGAAAWARAVAGGDAGPEVADVTVRELNTFTCVSFDTRAPERFPHITY